MRNFMRSRRNSLEQNMPYKLLRLGLGCNAGCLFCNIPGMDSGKNGFPDIKSVFGEIDSFFGGLQGVRISISGGEPTLYPRLCQVITYAREKSASTVELQTNGILLADRSLVRRLKKAGLTNAFVALHSHLSKVHDFMTGVPGSYDKCLRGILNLLEEGISVVLNPVITSANYRFIPDYPGFIRNRFREINFISLSVIQPRERAWKNRALIPKYSIIDAPVRAALEASDKFGLIVNNPICGLPLCVGGWSKRLEQCVEYSLAELGLPIGEGKVKPESCLNCRMDRSCGGVWAEYSHIHGFDGLKYG